MTSIFVLLAVLTSGVWVAVAIARYGLQTVAFAATGASAFFMPMISLRVAPSVSIGDALLLSAIGLASTAVLIRRYPLHFRPLRSVTRALVLVVAGGVLGSLLHGGGSGELVSFGAGVGSVIVCFGLQDLAPDQIRRLCWAFALGSTTSGLVGILLGYSVLGSRLYGLSHHPNHLAMVNVLALGMTLGLVLTTSQGRARSIGQCLALCHLVIVFMTGSRAGVIGVVVVVGAATIVTRRRHLAIALGGGATALFVVLATGVITLTDANVLSRLAGGGGASASDVERADALSSTWETIGDSPILGAGFSSARAGHSVPLQLWQVAGIFGLMAFVVLVATTVRSLRHPHSVLSVGLWSGYAGYLAASLVSNQLWDRYVWLALALASLAAAGGVGLPLDSIRPGSRSLPRGNLQSSREHRGGRHSELAIEARGGPV
ncbi:MAG TPA: O-antigen ligase family protein [Acidimicrobiales bacterium]|nr:O-antigen ligase family protein [Acidimicrobiales bacterium]